MLQRSPDLAVGEGSASPSTPSCRSLLQRSPDLAVGEGSGLRGAALAEGSRFNGAPTSRSGKAVGADRREPRPEASTEPRPRGRGRLRPAGPPASASRLQRSPDLAVGEGWVAGPSRAAGWCFNGAPTSRSGKVAQAGWHHHEEGLLQRSPDLAVGEGAPEKPGALLDTYHLLRERCHPRAQWDERDRHREARSGEITGENRSRFSGASGSATGDATSPLADPRARIRLPMSSPRVTPRWVCAHRLHTPSRGSRTPPRRAPPWGRRR